jgi:hypothetical protein
MRASADQGRAAAILATSGALWGLALTVAAFTVDVSVSERLGPGGARLRESYTLVDGTGTSGVLWALGPTIAGVIAWLALHRVCTQGSWWALGLAWTLIGAGFVIGILGALTIGMYFWPMVLLFGFAARRTPRPVR